MASWVGYTPAVHMWYNNIYKYGIVCIVCVFGIVCVYVCMVHGIVYVCVCWVHTLNCTYVVVNIYQ